MEKKELFKRAILEFQETALPELVPRALSAPLDSDRVITIYGPRRAGKTFFLYQLIGHLAQTVKTSRIIYFNLEDERLLPLDVREMHLLLDGYFELFPDHRDGPVFLFLDEIQVVSGWEVFIRRLHESRRFRIFLTGSSARLLSREIATSLRGRTLAYRLTPLSFREYLRFRNIPFQPETIRYSESRFPVIHALDEYLEWGGYPEVVAAEPEIALDILRNYFEMIVFRDIADRFSLRNSLALKNLLKYLLTNVSNLFSVNRYQGALEPGMGASRDTLQEYLSCILETDIVAMIPRFSFSLKTQEKKPKKVYSIDNGLRKATAFVFSGDEGRLAENLVFQELTRAGFEVFYWKEKQEVDFIARKESETWAVNVSYGDSLPEREIRGLRELGESKLKVDRKLLVTKNLDERRGEVEVVPLWMWLLGSGLRE
jgi:predicted AAA+ superfamily ATPase